LYNDLQSLISNDDIDCFLGCLEGLLDSKAMQGDPEDLRTKAEGSSFVLNPYTLQPLGN